MANRQVTFTCPYCGKEFTCELTRKSFDCPGCGKLLQFPKTDKENEQRRAFEDIFNIPLGKDN
jgi:predicted RNA-binding Zn-ribbon protein involved in translation (DUF1610 family)